jgi:hypothetical protein
MRAPTTHPDDAGGWPPFSAQDSTSGQKKEPAEPRISRGACSCSQRASPRPMRSRRWPRSSPPSCSSSLQGVRIRSLTITLTLTLAPIPYTPGTGTLRALGTLLARSGHAPPPDTRSDYGVTLRASSGQAPGTRCRHAPGTGTPRACSRHALGTLCARSGHALGTLWARSGHAPGTGALLARSGHALSTRWA